jgi:hypothetical protein
VGRSLNPTYLKSPPEYKSQAENLEFGGKSQSACWSGENWCSEERLVAGDATRINSHH